MTERSAGSPPGSSIRSPASATLRRVWLWGPVAGYMAVMFYLSSQSYPPTPPRVWDKFLHVVEYFGLAVLVCRAIAGGLPPRIDRRVAWLTFAITVGYGLTDELHQLFVPERSADFRDLIADAVGAAAAVIACWAWHIIRNPRRQIPNLKTQR